MEALDKQDPEAEERKRIRQEYHDGYPTAETIAQFLEAHEKGEDAIAELLKRRHALRLGKTE